MSSRIALVCVLIAAIAIGAVLFFRHKTTTPSQNCPTSMPRIVAFGDSLVAGYGATTPGGFVSILSQESGVPITNLGVNGDTSAGAKARLDAVISAKPDITLVLLGGNDALQRVPLVQTEQNLTEIVSTIQQSGSKVILLGVLGGFPSDPYAAMFERLAKTSGAAYVPNVLSGLLGHPSLMSDQVHPNQAGYQKIADRLLPVLEKECAP